MPHSEAPAAAGRRAPIRVLVVTAHANNELLGCGGTIALHARFGDHVTTVVVCEGESTRHGRGAHNMEAQTMAACRKLGVNDIRLLGFADQRLDTFALTEIINPLEQIVREVRPQLVYTQHGGDLNRDHEVLFKAVLVATRPPEAYIDGIYSFDTASSTEWAFPRAFVPDTWVDISSTLETKLDAMACYQSELRDYPHPRSFEALQHRAKAWGNQSCLDVAEVFMTVRRVYRHGQPPF